MTMLKWFDSKKVDEFADWLVIEILKRYPPAGLDSDPIKATRRFLKVHDSLVLRVQAFANANKLNIYTKARLGTRVKAAMREAGYPRSFADEFAHEIVTVIAAIRTGSKPSTNKP